MHWFYWHSWLSPRVSYALIANVSSNFYCLVDKQHSDDIEYCRFHHQLFHSSLAKILRSVQEGMTIPDVMQTPDSHLHCAIYSLGSYIADYPEQALLTCMVQGWCPQYVASACTTYPEESH